MKRPFWRRAAALLVALSLSVSFVAPASAYEVFGSYNRYRTDSELNGWNWWIPVCLEDSIKAPTPGEPWDSSVNRVERMREAITTINQDPHATGDFDLHYSLSNTACSYMRAQNITHLEIRYGSYPLGQYGHTDLDDHQSGCVVWCLKWATITMNQNEDWYMGDDTWVPSGRPDFGTSFLHELGHATGLAHSEKNQAIMCSVWDGGSDNCRNFRNEDGSDGGWVVGPGQSHRYWYQDDLNGLVQAF